MMEKTDAVLPPKVPHTSGDTLTAESTAHNPHQTIDDGKVDASNVKKHRKKKKKRHKKKHKKRSGSGEARSSSRATPPMLESFFGDEGGSWPVVKFSVAMHVI